MGAEMFAMTESLASIFAGSNVQNWRKRISRDFRCDEAGHRPKKTPTLATLQGPWAVNNQEQF